MQQAVIRATLELVSVALVGTRGDLYHAAQATGIWITIIACLCLAVQNARAPASQATRHKVSDKCLTKPVKDRPDINWGAAVPEAKGPA